MANTVGHDRAEPAGMVYLVLSATIGAHARFPTLTTKTSSGDVVRSTQQGRTWCTQGGVLSPGMDCVSHLELPTERETFSSPTTKHNSHGIRKLIHPPGKQEHSSGKAGRCSTSLILKGGGPLHPTRIDGASGVWLICTKQTRHRRLVRCTVVPRCWCFPTRRALLR